MSGSEAGAARQLDRLRAALGAEWDRALGGVDPCTFTATSLEETLRAMAASID